MFVIDPNLFDMDYSLYLYWIKLYDRRYMESKLTKREILEDMLLDKFKDEYKRIQARTPKEFIHKIDTSDVIDGLMEREDYPCRWERSTVEIMVRSGKRRRKANKTRK